MYAFERERERFLFTISDAMNDNSLITVYTITIFSVFVSHMHLEAFAYKE